MNKALMIVGLCLIAVMQLSAGNSIFSYDGYPVQFFGRDIYSLGMGDTGASDIFRPNNGYANPALHNTSNSTMFATGIILGYTRYASQSDSLGTKKFTDNSLDFPYFSMNIPYKRHRFGFQFNSYASGWVSNQTTFSDSLERTNITEKQEMDRYLYRADLIYSIKLGGLSLGVSGNYYFGHETRTFVQESNSGVFNTREKLARSYKNPAVTFGILDSGSWYSVGMHYSPAHTLKGESQRSSIHETEPATDYEYKMPGHFSASATFIPKKNYKIATDLTYEDWTDISADYTQSYKVGVGFAYEPAQDVYKSLLASLPLRGGVSWRKLPFKDSTDKEIDELALSLGLTFALKRDVNRIDLGLQYTKRGNLSVNHLSDDSVMLMVGFTGFDILSKSPDRKAPRDIPVKEDTEEW
ncbi:MAG TPA: hypothetical protein PL124_05135 [Candidatus Cloacimonadota bacterium]|nr:hypothetical protein [Candidatus Cloacimonadota bacterium]HPS38780.1 hypothetical protein [Candidatus Cloacimonadota bacterium]